MDSVKRCAAVLCKLAVAAFALSSAVAWRS
jgi:hypothetical protein